MKLIKVRLLLSYMSVASASAAIITPALPQIQHALHLSKGSVEWIVSIYLLGYLLGQLIYGPVANAFGRVKALKFGFGLNLIGIIVCLIASYTSNFPFLIIGRFITALGASAGLTCTFILINELMEHDRARHALSYAVVSFTAGIGLAVLIGGLLTTYFNWVFCFWFLLIYGLLMFLSLNLFQEQTGIHKHINIKVIITNYIEAFSNKKLISYSIIVGFVSLTSYCYSAAAPIIAQKLLNLHAAEYSYWNLLNMIGMLLGVITVRKLTKFISDQVILFSNIGITLLCVLLIIAIATYTHLVPTVFFILSAIIYFSTSMLFPTASHSASTAIIDKASASSIMNVINLGSAVIGVSVMGYLPTAMLNSFVIIVFGFGVISLFVLYFMFRQRCSL